MTRAVWLRLRGLAPEAWWGLAILGPVLVLGTLVPTFGPYDAYGGSAGPLGRPTLDHPFGTDNLGRDVFTRTFSAAQLDFALALVGVSVPLVVGTLIGAVIGTTRIPAVSSLWSILIDGVNAFPNIVLVIALVSILGPGVSGILIALAMTNWARYARIARARALTLRDAEFVQATEVLGYSRLRVLLGHILPNVYAETLAYALSDFVIVIITVAGLSFLGVGVRPPAPEWGAMMADGRLYLASAPWITVAPGLILSLTAAGVALLVQGLESRARGDV
jgi:peptide/nickel transport system permease protein